MSETPQENAEQPIDLSKRPFVTLSVPFNGGAIGSVSIPVPFTVRDLEMLRTFSHYLINTFGAESEP